MLFLDITLYCLPSKISTFKDPHFHWFSLSHTYTKQSTPPHLSLALMPRFIWVMSPALIPISTLIWELIGGDNGSFGRIHLFPSILVFSPFFLHTSFSTHFLVGFPGTFLGYSFDCKMNEKNYKITKSSGKDCMWHATLLSQTSHPTFPTSSHPPSHHQQQEQ